MKLVNIKSLEPGVILAQTIYNESGLVLIQKNVKMTGKMINRLKTLGINYVYIEDEHTKDIFVQSVIPSKLQVNAIHTIKQTFTMIQHGGFKEKAYLVNNKESTLTAIIERIFNEIKNTNEALSLLSNIIITDDYTFQHSLNVTMYSLAIGINLNFTDKELSALGIGAVLHDVGKVFVDQDILQKKDKLTDEEFDAIKEHTQLGFDYLRTQTDLSLIIAHCAYQHHERIDGTGYPRNLSGEDIHKYAKVIAIADVFDAVTSNRIYRDALLPHEGLEILYAGAVNKFDKGMVEAFKKSVVIYPNGLTVTLSDGRRGIVVKQSKYLCDRPIIRILEETDHQISIPYELNLAEKHAVTITSCYAG